MIKKVIGFNRLPKQEYLKPAINVEKLMQMQMLCGSLTDATTTGLDDENLGYDENGGDQGSAWARKRNGVWDDEELMEEEEDW